MWRLCKGVSYECYKCMERLLCSHYSLKEVVTLFWTFKVPWGWAYSATGIPEWIVQFAFGFYSMMLTSTLIGLIVMVLYKPRTWCAFCPMGTMTQGVCQLRAADEKK